MSSNNPILTYGGDNHILGALDEVDSTATEVVLGDGEEDSVFGMVEPDSVLVWENLNLFCANDDGTDVLLGTDEEGCVFVYLDVPAVLEWGGVANG